MQEFVINFIRDFMRDFQEGKLPEGCGKKIVKKIADRPDEYGDEYEDKYEDEYEDEYGDEYEDGYCDEDEYDIYLDLPIKKDEPVFVTLWGCERKAAALFHKEDVEKIMEAFEKLSQDSRIGRQLSRMFLCTVYQMEYEENLGFAFHPILLDKDVEEWVYIENTENTENTVEDERDCTKVIPEKDGAEISKENWCVIPYAFIAAKEICSKKK